MTVENEKTIIKNDVEVDGKVVEVEYFSYGFSLDYGDLTLLENIALYCSKARRKIKDFYWQVRYGIQRMFRGYDVTELFETHSNFTKRYKKILLKYRQSHLGYPAYLTNEQWEAIIDRMLFCLEFMDESTVEEFLMKDMHNDVYPSPKTVYDLMEQYKNEFFKLFSEHFYDLWD